MITATEPSAKLYGEQSSSWGGCLTCHPHYDFNFFGFSKHGKIRRKILLFQSRLSLQHVPSSVIISETTHFSWSQGLRPLQWPFLVGRGHFFFRFRFGLRALIHPPTSQRDTDGEPKMLGENHVILGLEICWNAKKISRPSRPSRPYRIWSAQTWPETAGKPSLASTRWNTTSNRTQGWDDEAPFQNESIWRFDQKKISWST